MTSQGGNCIAQIGASLDEHLCTKYRERSLQHASLYDRWRRRRAAQSPPHTLHEKAVDPCNHALHPDFPEYQSSKLPECTVVEELTIYRLPSSDGNYVL